MRLVEAEVDNGAETIRPAREDDYMVMLAELVVHSPSDPAVIIGTNRQALDSGAR